MMGTIDNGSENPRSLVVRRKGLDPRKKKNRRVRAQKGTRVTKYTLKG